MIESISKELTADDCDDGSGGLVDGSLESDAFV